MSNMPTCGLRTKQMKHQNSIFINEHSILLFYLLSSQAIEAAILEISLMQSKNPTSIPTRPLTKHVKSSKPKQIKTPTKFKMEHAFKI